jgi:hypothetical protein
LEDYKNLNLGESLTNTNIRFISYIRNNTVNIKGAQLKIGGKVVKIKYKLFFNNLILILSILSSFFTSRSAIPLGFKKIINS